MDALVSRYSRPAFQEENTFRDEEEQDLELMGAAPPLSLKFAMPPVAHPSSWLRAATDDRSNPDCPIKIAHGTTTLAFRFQGGIINADRTLWCKKRRVNLRNMKTAMNIRRQLRALCLKEALLAEAPPPDPQPFAPLAPERAESLLKCFLRGFVSKTAVLAPDASYVTSQGKHVVAIHPASVLHGQKREAIMFLEHVYTQKNYAKKVSVIQANWIIEALQGGA
ncbi:hypothetical protein BN1708_011279 [Verticillium longisporum]|uniref:DEAD-box helicase OB fold domain-containing protein n=1 Tax=Verticillium longisporum TaxID=100787 RepID=A0A0G4KZQ3_VERLO|nr:hypothetical protein BN1708_011279 [Verticillium longisporum]